MQLCWYRHNPCRASCIWLFHRLWMCTAQSYRISRRSLPLSIDHLYPWGIWPLWRIHYHWRPKYAFLFRLCKPHAELRMSQSRVRTSECDLSTPRRSCIRPPQPPSRCRRAYRSHPLLLTRCLRVGLTSRLSLAHLSTPRRLGRLRDDRVFLVRRSRGQRFLLWRWRVGLPGMLSSFGYFYFNFV